MNIANDETISAITVKMEGISRTRLAPPRIHDHDRDSKRAEVEIHRVRPSISLLPVLLPLVSDAN